MTQKQKAAIMRKVAENKIEFVQFWFTDVLGFLKGQALPAHELDRALSSGKNFDGSSIRGFARIEKADMVAMPDPDTFEILPWESNGHKVGRMFCDIYEPTGQPFEGDPRFVLRRNLAKAKALGFELYAGPELEFFYFRAMGQSPFSAVAGKNGDCTEHWKMVTVPVRRRTSLLSPRP